jgi:prepilin-type N-terminal cleavage/methylation domain-containing protein
MLMCQSTTASSGRVKSRVDTVRPGYTLAELVIVLAIMAVIGALAYPALRGPSAKSRLRYLAKQLRGELVQVRLRAIETNTPWEFWFEVGGRRYFARPLREADEPTLAPGDLRGEGGQSLGQEAGQGDWQSGESAEVSAEHGPSFLQGELPAGTVFLSQPTLLLASRSQQYSEVSSGTFDLSVARGEVLDSASGNGRGSLSGEEGEPGSFAAGGSGLLAGGNFGSQWERIVFLPTGKADQNRLLSLFAAEGAEVTLLIRAVSGTALVGEVRSVRRAASNPAGTVPEVMAPSVE